jgi:type I restriction enzyme, S subunit
MKTIPKLRFQEFKEIWQHSKLANIAEFSKGKGLSKSDLVPDGGLECIRYGELYTIYGETISKVISRTNVDADDLVLSQANDVIIPASGETEIDIATASCVLRKGIALGGDLNIIRSKQNGVFLSYYLNSKKKKDIASLAQGISVVHLYSSQLALLGLNIPTLPEQQKIASFLSAVDKKIQQLTRKKELLEQYKKGVMQQLFSGKLRFKPENGKPYPKWEEKRLGDVAEIVGGGTPETSKPEYWDGPIQWFTPTEINQRFVTTSKRTITDEGLKNSSAKLLPIGTILFTSRATIAEISFAKIECATNQGFQSLIVNKNNDREYIYYWIKHNAKEFLRKSQGSTFPEISSKEVRLIKITKPSLEEQQKIASFLTALDFKIENVAEQIAHTQTFKKGLLQQMFV